MRFPPEPPCRLRGRPVSTANDPIARPKGEAVNITGATSCPALLFYNTEKVDAFLGASPTLMLKLRRGVEADKQYAIRAEAVLQGLSLIPIIGHRMTSTDALWWLYYNKFCRRSLRHGEKMYTIYINTERAYDRIERYATPLHHTAPTRLPRAPVAIEFAPPDLMKGMDKYLNIARQSRQVELARRPPPTLPPVPAPALTPTFSLIKDSLAGHAPKFLDPDGIIMECD